MIKNKLTGILLVVASMIMGIDICAQSIAPQSINNGGVILKNTNISLNFTVGELFVLCLSDSNGNKLGGKFTLGREIKTLDILKPDIITLDVNVFPVPASDLINIRINHSIMEQVIITITDIKGTIVYSGTYAGMSNNIGISTSSYSQGVYLLYLKDVNNHILGTYKVIKQ